MSDGFTIRRAVLVTALFGALLSLVVDLSVSGVSPNALVRTVVYLSIVAVAIFELFRETGTLIMPTYLAAVYGVLSAFDSFRGTNVSLMNPGTTLTLIILVAVAYVALRKDHSPGPVIGFALAIAAFSVFTAVYATLSQTHMIGFVLVGVIGPGVVLWIVFQLISSLAAASTTESKHARIQKALAGCSQALLNRGTPDPLNTALRVLLDATEADYAYIDVNRSSGSGEITWEIVAEASGANYPETGFSFSSGTYNDQPELAESLKRGEPSRVITKYLPDPIKQKYEQEGIKAELVAPIMIGDRWIGTLGYTDHVREGDWSEIEVDGLMRAAEMVGAYWEREAAREGLMELAQAKDRFIAAVSHELRTPLAAVVGFAAELAQRSGDYSAEDLAEMSRLIYTQGLELTHLVDDLLTSERAASGNLTIKTTEIELLAQCKDIVDSTVLESEVTIVGDEVLTHADALRTRQIIRNLLTNASRYGGRSVEIEVGSSETHAVVTVKDDGHGVSSIDADRIFDPYYRTQGEASVPDSVGLGLAVARQLAHLMGGDLKYRHSGGWTRFELTLPLAPTPAALAR